MLDVNSSNIAFGPLPAQSGDVPVTGHWIDVCTSHNGVLAYGQPACSSNCPVAVNAQDYFRFAPALDDLSSVDMNGENYLFVVNQGNMVNTTTQLPNRPWLWAFASNGVVPNSVTINSITATGRIGIIPWVDKNTQWVQVLIDGNATYPVPNIPGHLLIKGYLELTDKNNNQLAVAGPTANPTTTMTPTTDCLSSLPFSPPDPPKPPSVAQTPVPSPISTLALTFFLTPPVATSAPFGVSTPGSSSDLNGGLPSSVMGGCNFHNGKLQGNSCVPCATVTPTSGVSSGEIAQNCPYFTTDLVSGNTEFCIDVKVVSSQCDPNPTDVIPSTPNSIARIPVYAVLPGCIVYDHNNINPGLPGADITLVAHSDRKWKGYNGEK